MECAAFHFLNNHVEKHIMFVFQDDNVKIHQVRTLSPDLKFIESLCDVLEDTCAGFLHRCNTQSCERYDAPLDGNNITRFISRSRLRSANSCVKMILESPFQPFFHSLSLKNLDSQI